MKMKYEKPKASWISFQVEEELMGDVNIPGSRPGGETGTEIPPVNYIPDPSTYQLP